MTEPGKPSGRTGWFELGHKWIGAIAALITALVAAGVVRGCSASGANPTAPPTSTAPPPSAAPPAGDTSLGTQPTSPGMTSPAPEKPQESSAAAAETPFEACPDGSVCVWEGYYFTGGFKAYSLGSLNYAGDAFSDGIVVNDNVSSYYNNSGQWVNFYRDAPPAGAPCVREQPRGYRADLRVEGCDNSLSAHTPDGSQ
ncbi:peptidase inhibitor family I36 protein [Amycolatopsis sp. EV170708-02-1]|uniref:peptidase inhibitor family I36 protein n=1 Tax=Amycolatopsis sp. EV170708-02-1 TaxID=2919322 RepID=UPI001F0B8F5A|nr:peptidase inhibitor family I36 protein [Amycolatopsis sp. EV170708-02-1]UMP02030.1 peptidase inhibitor family I36 protein [Amycolatopsis sp. EV170708-02-1]